MADWFSATGKAFSSENRLLLEVPEYTTFKDGDVLSNKDGSYIFILNMHGKYLTSLYASLTIRRGLTTNMKTRTYEGVQHGDWVRCVLCGAQMLLPCGADKCPECSSKDTLMWVDENRQEMDAKHLDCLVPIRKLENVLKQLEEDVRFGFEKALNQRGISASLMFECVMMWNYILEEGLEDWDEDDYRFYGLPLFKATAVKYGWDNPIGEDSGRERKYDSQY